MPKGVHEEVPSKVPKEVSEGREPRDTPVGPPVWQRAAGRSRKGERRKGKIRSDPKENCVTRRVRVFLRSGQKSRSDPRGVKNKSGSSLARVWGDWWREGSPNLRESSQRVAFGLFCALRAWGHFRNVPLDPRSARG